MLLKTLRDAVLDANLGLVRKGLVLSNLGSVSGISREDGLIAIKPKGIGYWELKPEHIVVVNLRGTVIEGKLRPSPDLRTHLALYQMFPNVGAIAHSYSEYATAWAQACKPIPCMGTIHADYFHGPIPVTAKLSEVEVNGSYELNTGLAIARAFLDQQIDPASVPAALVARDGAFAWGAKAADAVENAAVLEAVARMSYFTLGINPLSDSIPKALHDMHFEKSTAKMPATAGLTLHMEHKMDVRAPREAASLEK